MHRGDITDPLVAFSPTTAMCTRRLRIVDASHARQPQYCAEGRIAVCFNGEIYNHRELRTELQAKGIYFRTRSDTEVLAAALLVWGAAALRRLDGMFAFVAVDLKNGEFLAARDPLGIKPLYLIQQDEGYLFCSEIKPLLDATETGDVLLLPPGHMLSSKLFGPYISQLTHPPAVIASGPAELNKLLAAAVHSHLPPELPVAGLFSGGIDSTLMMHYGRQQRPEMPGYFLGGPEAPDYRYAQEYAEKTDLDLRIMPFDPSIYQPSGLIERVVQTCEGFEPDTIRSAVCNYLLTEQVHKDGYRVALSGEGADELFCGYLPLELVFADGNELGRPVRDQFLAQMNRGNLQRVDRCSMHWQIETRVPFLDPSIINYALSLDAAELVKESGQSVIGKMPLRALYDLYPEQLPESIRDRTKVPFNEGAGFDKSPTDSPWAEIAEQTITDNDMIDAQKQFAGFDLRNKEEVLYFEILAKHIDVSRVPSLKGRSRVWYPNITRMEIMREFVLT